MVLWIVLLACSPEPSNTYALTGSVDVSFDDLGVAHITAEREIDAWYAQGYVTAHDRLFQMDLTRRRAWGRRAEVLGEDYYNGDVVSRSLQLGRHAEATAAALKADDPEIYAMLEAYAEGVNRFIVDAQAGRMELSPQFAALDYEPERWTVVDSLVVEKLITAGLSMRPDQDVILGLIQSLLGDAMFRDLYWFSPFDREYIVPDFYDGYAARSNPAGPVSRVPDALSGLSHAETLSMIRGLSALRLDHGGSNAFAVAGDLTVDGHALLASDSHQGIEHPAVYYMVHLRADDTGLDAVGANFPGVPMVFFGHNRHIAWGPTTSIYDVADAYLEEFTDSSKTAVLFDGEEVPIEVWEETVVVRTDDGDDTRTIELRSVPHHGPVLPAVEMGLPFAMDISIRWTGYQPRSAARAFFEMDKAGDYEDFRDAIDHYFTGGMHWVVAEDDGHIGYASYTDVPVRETVDADSPPVTLLDGTGGFEWTDDLLDRDDVPWVYRPDSGWLTSANNDPVGTTDDNDPFDDPVYLSGVFDIGTRAYRPARLIEAGTTDDRLDFDEFSAIQLDTLSRSGERLVPFIRASAARRDDLLTDQATEALQIIKDWDFTCDVDSVGCTLFHAWLAVFVRETLEDESGGLVGSLMFGEMDYKLGLVASKFAVRWLEETDDIMDEIEAGETGFPSASGRNFFDDARTDDLETRDELVVDSLVQAVDEMADVMDGLGADPGDVETWEWGLVHTIELRDRAHDVLPEASAPAEPKAGGLYTVDVGDYTWLVDGEIPAEGWSVTNAPSNRFVTEMAPGDIRMQAILPGGQSEIPGDRHHNDQFGRYLQGRRAEVPFYDDEIEAEEEERWEFGAGFPVSGELKVE